MSEMPDERPIDGPLLALERMWPGYDVTLSSRNRVKVRSREHAKSVTGGTGERRIDTSFRVVSSIDNPRMLVPDHRLSAASAMRRYSHAISPAELLTRFGTVTFLRMGGLSFLRDEIVLRGRGDNIVTFLSEVLGQDVRVSITVGKARANRKPVLGIFDSSGKLISYAKVGDTPVARTHVEGEVDALRTLMTTRLSTIAVPRLHFAGEWDSLYVLVMSALAARPFTALATSRRPAPVHAMNELSLAFSQGTMRLVDTAMVKDCGEVIAGLDEAEDVRRLSQCMDRVIGRHGDVLVRTGAWHGDFTPWNMAYRLSGPLMLWDWERFTENGIVGLDYLHFHSQRRIKQYGFTSAVLGEALVEIRTSRDDDAVHRATEAAYLLSLACRYVAAGQESGGSVIHSDAGSVLEVLEDITR